MKPETWKVIAIIFIVLFTIETSYLVLSYSIVTKEENRMNYCYYDICETYENADYVNGLCTCYEVGYMGEYVIAKEKYMK